MTIVLRQSRRKVPAASARDSKSDGCVSFMFPLHVNNVVFVEGWTLVLVVGLRGRGTPNTLAIITKAGQIGGGSPIGVPVGRDHPDNLIQGLVYFKNIS